MTRTRSLMYLSASLAALASSALAAPASAAPASAAVAEEATLGEIIVTARRQAERLQDVPQTVNAVSSDTLQKLNIRAFEDVQAVVPGLTLSSTSNSYQFAASMRGVIFDVTSQGQPSSALYLNDAPMQPSYVFQSLFDIGQIEVLKGPQGTTRGVSAPSGAITISTHRPNLSAFGGYVDGTLTDQRGRNINGAINLPIIKDVLAVRVAGIFDENSFDGVSSLHSNVRPKARTAGVRASVRYEPSDNFKANLTIQHLVRKVTAFEQVSGPGQGAFTVGATTYPATTNPALTPFQRTSVSDLPSRTKDTMDVAVLEVESHILGHHVSYIGSFGHQHLLDHTTTGGSQSGDAGNLLPGVDLVGFNRPRSKQTTQEIRIASEPGPDRVFDYTVGAFYNWQSTHGAVSLPGPLLPGAFGFTPGVPSLAAFNPAYQWQLHVDVNTITTQESSVFASGTVHLGPNTEISGGIRHIWSLSKPYAGVSFDAGLWHLGAPCNFLPIPGTTTASTPGDCLVPGPLKAGPRAAHATSTPTIYNVTLSHHFTHDLMVYGTTGTAFRPATNHSTFQEPFASSTLPALASIVNVHPPERSRSYELGFKSTWLDGRARLNASVYSQKFKHLLVFFPRIAYLAGTAVSTLDMSADVNAQVKGFDVEGAFLITPNWNVGASASYSDGKVKGGQVPCNITGANGQPVLNTAGLISLCPGGSTSRAPLWNATIQTEYTQPIRDNVDGFVRGLLTYYPQNKNRAEPNFTVNSYGLMNLYAGVRSHDGAWELSVFARNAFNTERVTDRSPVQENLNTPLGAFFPTLIRPSGYYQTAVTARREVGVHLQYAWGAR